MKKNHIAQPDQRKQKAQSLFQQGKLKKAKVLYEKLYRENNNDAESCYMLGAIYGQLGNYKKAEISFQRAIALQPTAFVAHCGLGSTLKTQGKLAEAENCFREALKIQPQFTDAQLELAHLLVLQKKLSEAETCLQQLIKTKPEPAMAYHYLGAIQQQRGNIHAAISCYQQALRINPRLAESHNRLGYAQFVLGELNDAVLHCRKAIEINPDYVEAYRNLGTALMPLGKMEEAISAYRKALALKPGYIDAIAGEATAYDHQGNFQKAYDRLKPLIEKDVLHIGVGLTYARLCRHFSCCPEAIDYLEKLLNHSQLPDTSLEQLHFTLGKLYDAMGSYDQAFSHYQKGNQLKLGNFDEIEFTGMIEALITTFTKKFVLGSPRASGNTETPVFIVGMPRSGTSLVEQILASHPDVYGAGELPDLGKMSNTLPTLLGPDLGYPACLNKLSQDNVDALSKQYITRLTKRSPDSKRITDKMPQNFLLLGLINLLFPKARVIHCMRDPRDTALSIYFQNFSAGHTYAHDLNNIAAYHRLYKKLMKHWHSVLDLPILDVQYEDIINDQEQQSRRLIKFVGLDWNDNCLDFHKTRRIVSTASFDQVRRPLYSSSVERWRHYEKHLGSFLE